MDFLICQVRFVKDQVRVDGYMSQDSKEIMSACGIEVRTIVHCQWLSSEAKKDLEETTGAAVKEKPLSTSDQSHLDTDRSRTTNKKPNGSNRKSIYSKWLVDKVRKAIASLEDRKKTLESIEEMEARTRCAMTLLPVDSVDRFSRAETAFERRMYRALGTLLALRGASSRGMKLPELPE